MKIENSVCFLILSQVFSVWVRINLFHQFKFLKMKQSLFSRTFLMLAGLIGFSVGIGQLFFPVAFESSSGVDLPGKQKRESVISLVIVEDPLSDPAKGFRCYAQITCNIN